MQLHIFGARLWPLFSNKNTPQKDKSTMSTAHRAAMAVLHIQRGEYLRVTGSCSSLVGGWRNTWGGRMDDLVGKVFRVIDRDEDHGFRIEAPAGAYYVPAFVVEKAEAPKRTITVRLNGTHTAEVTEREVKVGCQSFSFEAVHRLHDAVEEMKNGN